MSSERASLFRRALLAIAVSLLGTGCDRLGLESISRSPHERYARGLERAGLAGTALGRAWSAAAESSLRHAVAIRLPFRESHFYPAEEAWATAYRFELRRGQRLIARAILEPADSLGVFLDLFEPAAPGAAPRWIESARDSLVLEHEAKRDGAFLLRVQPELLRSGRLEVALIARPALAFPIAGHGSRAIGGRFGDPRDRGARRHHGVDLFAPRGTPVVAVSGGIVTSTATNALGGRVVWMLDPERRLALYYAHLDRQLVRAGQRVRRGDTLGLVGNTGNARGTPPHLHFGIYGGPGPVDPAPFIVASAERMPPIEAPKSALGRHGRLAGPARLEAGPGVTGGSRPVAAGAAVRIAGVAGRRYRVRFPSGATGYLHPGAIEWAAPESRRPVR